MAERLLRYYQHVSDKIGIGAKTELARRTKIPSVKAALEPDSQENIEKFREAVEAITGKPAPKF